LIAALSRPKAISSFCQIYLPGHSLSMMLEQEYVVSYYGNRPTPIGSISLCWKKRKSVAVLSFVSFFWNVELTIGPFRDAQPPAHLRQ
jgi:hypothetical protein